MDSLHGGNRFKRESKEDFAVLCKKWGYVVAIPWGKETKIKERRTFSNKNLCFKVTNCVKKEYNI